MSEQTPAAEAPTRTWADLPPPRFTSWYADAFRHRAAPLRALLVPTLPVAILGVVALVVLQLTGDTLVVNGQLDTLSLGPAWLVVALVLLVLGLAALTLGAGAAGLAVAAIRTGETRSVRWTVTAAARRWAALATYTVLVIVVLALSLAAAVGLVLVHAPVWFAVAVAVCVLIALACLLSLAWPLVLVESRGLPRAIARSWQVTEHVRPRTGLKVLVFGYAAPIAVLALVRYGFDAAGEHLPVWPWQLVDTAVVGAVGTVAVTLMASVHVGVLFSLRVPLMEEPYLASPLQRDRVTAALSDDGAPEWRRLPQRPRTVAVAMVVAVLLPGLLNGGLLWWNPTRAASYTTAEVNDATGTTSNPFPQRDGSTLVTVSSYLRLRHCAGSHCTYAIPGTSEDAGPDPLELSGSSVTDDGHGGLVFAGWRTDETNGRTAPRLRLFACRPSGCTDDAFDRGHPAVLDTYHPSNKFDEFSRYDVVTAVARRGHGYVVAALGTEQQSSHVVLYQCDDARCADPTRTDLGSVDVYSVRPGETRILSLAVAPDGRPVLTVADAHTGEVHLLVCSDARCGHSTWRDAVPPTMVSTSYEVLRLGGASVAVLPDGRPVLAYREVSSGTSVLALCRDRDCTGTTTRRLTGPGWAHPWPALAVDRAGHPMVATYDLARKHLVLVACRDAGCASTATARLATWKNGPGYVSLALDPAGRPVLAWADTEPLPTFIGSGSIHVLRCLEPACGATR